MNNPEDDWLSKVMQAAIDTWGDEDKAHAFMNRPHAMLDGKKPIDVAAHSDAGTRLVKEILGRLKHGSYS